jgi:hypothetical protein
MKRPIAVVFELDTDKYPDYLDCLPDFLASVLSKADEKNPPAAINVDELICFQFPEDWDQGCVEEHIEKVCDPWPSEKALLLAEVMAEHLNKETKP